MDQVQSMDTLLDSRRGEGLTRGLISRPLMDSTSQSLVLLHERVYVYI